MAVTHGGDIFAIARARGWEWREIADFSASINPLGPAPGVEAAIRNSLDRIAHYPEREPARLKNALAAAWNVDEQQILLGNGATELIFFIARMIGRTPVTLATPVFSEFHRAFPDAKLTVLEQPALWPREGMLVLTRPANPTGFVLPLKILEEWLEDRMQTVLIDESFLEFAGHQSAASLLARHPRLIILRSLTKFYALPGLRIGALITSAATIAEWRERREPWQVNVLAEEAALAALADSKHAESSVAFVQSEGRWLFHQLTSMPKAEPAAGNANFLYVRLAYPACAFCEYLLERKILVRNCADWPGLKGEAVRVAVRTRAENQRLVDAWRWYPCG